MVEKEIRASTASLDYVAVVDESLRVVEMIGENRTTIIAVAGRIGGTRLIDNILLPSASRV